MSLGRGVEPMKFKSITTRMTLFFGVLIVIICLGLGLSAFSSFHDTLQENINENLLEIAETNARLAAEKVKSQLNALETLANSWWLKSDEFTTEQKLEFLKDEAKRAGHDKILLIDRNGDYKDTEGGSNNVGERDYFIKALAGKPNVSDPIISKADSSLIIMFAVPIKDGDKVTGVLAARRDGSALSNFTRELQYGERHAYMINKDGTTVAHDDINLVLNMSNTFIEYLTNPELEQLYNLEKKMAAGETGVGEYTYNGVAKYMGYALVEGTDWSLAVTAPKSTVMEKVVALTSRILILSVFFFAVGMVLTILISIKIAKPIKEAARHLNVIATGDFTGEIPGKFLNMKDETGILANALDKMKNSVRTMMKEVADESSAVSQMLNDISNNIQNLNQKALNRFPPVRKSCRQERKKQLHPLKK